MPAGRLIRSAPGQRVTQEPHRVVPGGCFLLEVLGDLFVSPVPLQLRQFTQLDDLVEPEGNKLFDGVDVRAGPVDLITLQRHQTLQVITQGRLRR